MTTRSSYSDMRTRSRAPGINPKGFVSVLRCGVGREGTAFPACRGQTAKGPPPTMRAMDKLPNQVIAFASAVVLAVLLGCTFGPVRHEADGGANAVVRSLAG
jgi:hypothetical protein